MTGQRRTYRGTAVVSSDGVAVGRVQKLTLGRHPIPEYCITGDDVVQEEGRRLSAAIGAAVAELEEELSHLERIKSQEPLHILEAHRMLLLDPELASAVKESIRQQKINAEWALRKRLDTIEAEFDRVDDPYLRSKKMDIEQIGKRILRHLSRDIDTALPLPDGNEPQILVGHDFTPSEVIQLWRQGFRGFISELGGINNHVIIIARGVGIPAMMGTSLLDKVQDGDTLIIDGKKSVWIINPSEEELAAYRRVAEDLSLARNKLQAFARKPAVTADGRRLKIMANLEFTEELPLAREIGTDGIGLYRTEFLFLNNEAPPTEEEQYHHYAEVVQGMSGLPVTFRLLDIGGDKPVLFDQIVGHQAESMNPAMGLRGVRLLLHQPELLRNQLRALLRASLEGSTQILVPMVSNPDQMVRVRTILNECAQELDIASDIPLGSMIEVPAAALIADELARVSDFFSIGTNDLIQYTLATDRGDEETANLYEPGHQAIRTLIDLTVRAAKKAGIPVSMCGEMAGDPEWTEMLLDMGMDTLSMSLSSVLEVRKRLSEVGQRPASA